MTTLSKFLSRWTWYSARSFDAVPVLINFWTSDDLQREIVFYIPLCGWLTYAYADCDCAECNIERTRREEAERQRLLLIELEEKYGEDFAAEVRLRNLQRGSSQEL